MVQKRSFLDIRLFRPPYRDSKLHKAAMNVITRANWENIKEAKAVMCEALRELMAEEFEEERGRGKEQERITIIRNAYESREYR